LDEKLVETTLYSLSASPPGRPDRRHGERFLSLLRVGALIIGDRRELCLIRNISAGGMMIRPYSPIAQGTPLSVELKQGDTVSGIAQWAENGLLGIAFDNPIDVVALLTAPGEGPQPRMPRIELDCTATLPAGADIYRSHALNVSQGGICVRTREDMRIGAHVIVSIPGLPPTAGVVKWRQSDMCGVSFNRVFPIEQLMSFLQDQQGEESRRAAG
jgi:hypothetical protein